MKIFFDNIVDLNHTIHVAGTNKQKIAKNCKSFELNAEEITNVVN